MNYSELIFIKLGGSLITDKTRPLTPRLDVIQQSINEISQIWRRDPQLNLLIGHGAGSFGHSVADRYQTQAGVHDATSWKGFIEVWAATRKLNQIIIDHLTAHDLPVIAFPPSAGVIAEEHVLKSWDTAPLLKALSHHLIPVVQGDVVFDQTIGGTILSTEEVFLHLADILRPRRILLAGSDPGVYRRPGETDEIINQISSQNIDQVLPALSGAETTDVTGGMAAKVKSMYDLVQKHSSSEVLIFSGMQPGNIQRAIQGEYLGTLIKK
jgi:isopentenyl phosphate kinase